MIRNYDPFEDFKQKFSEQVRLQFKTIYDLKTNDSPNYEANVQHPTLRADKSDRYTFIRHIRNMKEVIEVSDLFEGREVIDVGCGFGGCYYPLRFGNPSKLIAIDPFKENIELAKELGYDECHQFGWEEYTFPKYSVAFLRGILVPEYEVFFKKMQEEDVTDIIFIHGFITTQLCCHAHMFHNPIQNGKINRWLFNRPTDYIFPSIGEVRRIASNYNFGLVSKNHYIDLGPKFIKTVK